MAYLDSKGKGDISMPENQRSWSGADAMRWEARVTWRKLDCLNPNLRKMQRNVHRKRICHRCRTLCRHERVGCTTFGCGAILSERIQGDEWGA